LRRANHTIKVKTMKSQIVYIIGNSFSGSTILGALLAAHPSIECAGELANWTEKEKAPEMKCSCGQIRKECLFWKSVKENWFSLAGLQDWGQYKNIQSEIEHLRTCWPAFFGQKVRMPLGFDVYSGITRALFQAIERVSGRPITIDISKRPGRALALSHIQDLEVSYIHLVRDGRAFLSSNLKRRHRQGRKSRSLEPGRSGTLDYLVFLSLEWAINNRIAEQVMLQSNRPWLRIRYEDLTSDPVATLGAIGNFLRIDATPLIKQIQARESISFRHIGGGNRARFLGPTELRADESWRQTLPPGSEFILRALAGRMQRRYGY
jgi:hypothetical protein